VADVRIIQIATMEAVNLDWLLSPATGLDQTQELVTAVIVALGTNKLALETDELPGLDDTYRHGWWGDLDAATIWNGWPIGSRLWLLRRSKITDSAYKGGSTTQHAQLYAQEALTPFVLQKICSAVDVQVTRVSYEQIKVACTLYRGPKEAIELRFDGMWQELIDLAQSVY